MHIRRAISHSHMTYGFQLVPIEFKNDQVMYQSIPSLTIPPPRPTPGNSHIVVASGVGFSLLCLARGSAPGGLNQSKSSIILKKSAIFALSLKQMGSSSFDMFIYRLEVSSEI